MAAAQFLNPQQIDRLPSSPADRRIHYGSEPFQFGDLRLPQAPGSHPVAVVIHGGCWKYRHGDLTADLQNTAALSSALTSHGIATWNIEYRQIDLPGGGWTGTFEDVANAIDYLRVLAKPYTLDLDRVAIVGHSAGGHLGTWAAARHRLPQQSHFLFKEPLRVVGVVNLAGVVDLETFLPMQNQACGEPAITTLIGGSPTEVPDSPKGTLGINADLSRITSVPESGHRRATEFGMHRSSTARQSRDDRTAYERGNGSCTKNVRTTGL
ncbi:esterase/lipase [Chamaesiphon minutus PCC 6605]|uniref:Esterase/lipase n=1 Tax=Chamaesiphon minutus (strain ATCC 27169 / PCC 6605) TaxID=1173020 RepID=K9UFX5_CHAP6|nr:alpha/beta hydrolase [Chamaesiphon minutus]AFY93296.1 esterase/lipase [Chamaesiphon minutus PCC 6605]